MRNSFQEMQAQLISAVEAVGEARPGIEWQDAVLGLCKAIRAASPWVEHGEKGPERDALLKELLETEQFLLDLNLPNLWEDNLLRNRGER